MNSIEEMASKKGREEQAIMTVKTMLKKGFNITLIAEITGLAEEIIATLSD